MQRFLTSPADQLAVALVGAALAVLGGWWLDAQPVPVADGTAGRLQCISYAPSDAGVRNPRGVTREQVQRDLALLAQRTTCVRTYTVSEGFAQVPEVARELGLEVLLGAWIGGDAAHNEREVALVIDTAQRHRDTVRAIVVGNEVLLRHELTPEQLAVLVRRVGDATGMPVTYADVWGFWVKHRVLARSGLVRHGAHHSVLGRRSGGHRRGDPLRGRLVCRNAAHLPRQGRADWRDGLAERRATARRRSSPVA